MTSSQIRQLTALMTLIGTAAWAYTLLRQASAA
jgi:hypothetical protein